MQRDEKSETVNRLEERLTERYGVLLSQTQLANLLNRTPGGLRYSLCHPPDFQNPQAPGLRSPHRSACVLSGGRGRAHHRRRDPE